MTLARAAGAAAGVRLAHRVVGDAARWGVRTNYRGRSVSMAGGPALALALAGSADVSRAARLVASVGAAAVGRYDDVVAHRTGTVGVKGLRGHVTHLAAGRVTTGAVKIAGLVGIGVVAARLRGRAAPAELMLQAGVVAGAANLLNLLDLRPGRALKVGAAAGLVLGRPAIAGACLGQLPDDLAEREMLGDAGANALGAVIGIAVLERVPGRWGRATVLAVLAGLTLTSELVSFTRVIDDTPLLRWLDRLGRVT